MPEQGQSMAKAKRKHRRTKTLGLRIKILMSFEWPKRLLPKRKYGILVSGETFTIQKEGSFTVRQLKKLIKKGYIKLVPKKTNTRKKRKRKAAR